MNKKKKVNYNKLKENVDLQDINELMEMGLKKEEISRELGISQKYIKKVFNDYYKDY
jgi:hypothetical protein